MQIPIYGTENVFELLYQHNQGLSHMILFKFRGMMPFKETRKPQPGPKNQGSFEVN
jgi:hypothetical protein